MKNNPLDRLSSEHELHRLIEERRRLVVQGEEDA
jgi:hypothetical protein